MPKTMIDFDNKFYQLQHKFCNNFITLILKVPWIFFSNYTISWPYLEPCLMIITFSFDSDHSNLLFKDLKLLNLPHILESKVIKFFYKFSGKELPKSVCNQLNLVHEVYTCDAHNNLLVYTPRMSTIQYGKHSLHGNGASLWNGISFFKNFFKELDVLL